MKAQLKSGKIIKGDLAKTFVRCGLAQEIKPKEVVSDTTESAKTNAESKSIVITEKPKRVRRTKAQIKADKKK